MKKTLAILITAAVGVFALSGCIYLPATSAPEAPVETITNDTPTETPAPEPIEVTEEPVSEEDEYLDFVRRDLPEARYFTDDELLRLAMDSCTIADAVGFEEGIVLLASESHDLGLTEDEAYVVGYLYGAGVAFFCPEYLP